MACGAPCGKILQVATRTASTSSICGSCPVVTNKSGRMAKELQKIKEAKASAQQLKQAAAQVRSNSHQTTMPWRASGYEKGSFWTTLNQVTGNALPVYNTPSTNLNNDSRIIDGSSLLSIASVTERLPITQSTTSISKYIDNLLIKTKDLLEEEEKTEISNWRIVQEETELIEKMSEFLLNLKDKSRDLYAFLQVENEKFLKLLNIKKLAEHCYSLLDKLTPSFWAPIIGLMTSGNPTLETVMFKMMSSNMQPIDYSEEKDKLSKCISAPFLTNNGEVNTDTYTTYNFETLFLILLEKEHPFIKIYSLKTQLQDEIDHLINQINSPNFEQKQDQFIMVLKGRLDLINEIRKHKPNLPTSIQTITHLKQYASLVNASKKDAELRAKIQEFKDTYTTFKNPA